jgi:nitrogen regulatory protein P-II
MKMLAIIFRASLEGQLLELLNKHGVTAYSEIYKVVGAGETERVPRPSPWPGTNSMLIVVLPEDRAERLVTELQQFHSHWEDSPHRPKLPIRLFAWDCVQRI